MAGGSYGLALLKQDFDQDWFLPPNSWTVKYNKVNDDVSIDLDSQKNISGIQKSDIQKSLVITLSLLTKTVCLCIFNVGLYLDV